jgi:hypothetical protein
MQGAEGLRYAGIAPSSQERSRRGRRSRKNVIRCDMSACVECRVIVVLAIWWWHVCYRRLVAVSANSSEPTTIRCKRSTGIIHLKICRVVGRRGCWVTMKNTGSLY